MRGVLLDTHIFLWFTANDRQLPRSVLRTLKTTKEDVLLSVASGFEMAVKRSLGKLNLGIPFETLITEGLSRRGIQSLPILTEHLRVLSDLPLPPNGHRDPFDRLLVAQARSEGLQLLTADRALAAYGVAPVGAEPDGRGGAG